MGLFNRIALLFDDWHASTAGSTVGDTPTINPATGLPMTGGIDVAGNPFGTDLASHHHDHWQHDPHRSGSAFDDCHALWLDSFPSGVGGEARMTRGVSDTVPWSDRLLARWEVSRFAVVPFSISLFAAPISWPILALALFGGRRSAVVTVVLLIIWAVPVGLDQARGWWLWRHPHASPRWLRAVYAATGDAVFDEALAHLTILHGDDLGYRIERAHVANAVQVAWNARRKDRQRAEGVCLGDASGQA